MSWHELSNVIEAVNRWVRGDEAPWPYARCLEEWGPEYEMYRKRWRAHDIPIFNPERAAVIVEQRLQYINCFGFAIPCGELFDELRTSALVVEIGAGSGYMTAIMRHCGIRVTGSDTGHWEWRRQFDDKQVRADGKTMVRRYPKAVIFCSWPSHEETWYRQALKAMRVGQRIVTIMEDSCAEDGAQEYFDACFEIARTIPIPTFSHMNDQAYVAIKKRQRGQTHELDCGR